MVKRQVLELLRYYTTIVCTALLEFVRISRVSWYQQGKTNLGLEQEIVSGSGICWAICKSDLTPDR